MSMMTNTNSTEVVMLGAHSKAVEEQNKQRAIDRLVEAGFKRTLVSDALEGVSPSTTNLSIQILKKADQVSPALLRYSAAVMMAAYYNNKKRMPIELVNLVVVALKVEKFNKRETKSLNEQKELVRFIVVYPNASLTAAGVYLGKLFERPKVHVETIKSWCRVVGVEEILSRISTGNYKTNAIVVKRNCRRKRMYLGLTDRKKKPSKRGIYAFLQNEK
tara:strand:- start:1416 stop:2069 length:654 start_codon:yes stop_codon:yes gene_type:complete